MTAEQHALERAPSLWLPGEAITQSYDIVRAALGAAWLEEQEKLVASARRGPHPLFTHLTATTDTATLEVCELALYLREFHDDPAIPAILTDLRDAGKFHPVFLELAHAFRWKDAGATVGLRPATPTGEADFAGVLHELSYTVEVSTFEYDPFMSEEFRLANVVTETATSVLGKAEPAPSVRVSVETVPPGNLEAALRAAVKEACLVWKGGKVAPSQVTKEFGTVHVEALAAEEQMPTLDVFGRPTFTPDGDWAVVIRAVEKEQDAEEPLYRLVGRPGREYARIHLRMPPDERDVNARIMKKLKKEVDQLRGVKSPRVVILDLSDPAFGDIFELDGDALTAPTLRIMRSTPELACVWLTMRRWTTAFRHKYFGQYIDNPFSIYRLPQDFLDRLVMREWRWDFIGEREYPETESYEDALRQASERAEELSF